MRKLSAKWVPKFLNADQKRQRCQSSEQLLEFFRRDSNDFLSGAISDHGRNLVISLWPGYKATNNGVAAYWFTPPRNIPSPKIRLDFLASRRHHPHWLSSKGPNYQRGVLLISSGLIEGHFEVKAPREVHEGGLVLSRQFPGSPGTCNPRRNWPTWASSVLITHRILRIWLHLSLDWKNNWNVAIFRPTRRSLLPRRPGWTDSLLNFFEWLVKVRTLGEEVYWGSLGVLWINPEFGRCSFSPSWSGKGLISTSSYKSHECTLWEQWRSCGT